MKMKSWIWAGCVAIIMGAMAFVACDDQSKGGAAGDLIGTWRSVPGSTMYAEEVYILTFNADNTGSFRYIEDEQDEVDGFAFTYTFDAKTNIGVMYRKSEYYGEKDGTEFKLVWKSKDQVEVYVREYEGMYDEWEHMGIFMRQEEVKNASIVGSWKWDVYYEGESVTLTFNANGTCSYAYLYGSETIVYSGTYTYNVSTCLGEMTLSNPEYPEEPTHLQFKVEWLNENTVNVYVEDSYYGESEWYFWGYFTRN